MSINKLALIREVLQTAGLPHRHDVSIKVEDNRVAIMKTDTDRSAALDIGRRFMEHHARTLRALAK